LLRLPLILGFLAGLISVLVLTPFAIRFSQKKSLFDVPNKDRQMHSTPIPRIGGVAIIFSFYIGLLACYLTEVYFGTEIPLKYPGPHILISIFAIGVLGLIDDLKNLNFRKKLVVQILIILVLLYFGVRLTEVEIPFSQTTWRIPEWISWIVSFVWLLGLVNAINFLDGMDGLASGVLVVIFATLSATFLILGQNAQLPLVIVVTGVLVGFLRYNFNPAKIFMGDSGSLFLGLLLATYSISNAQKATSILSICIPLIAMGLPLLDTSLAVIRRIAARQSIFSADRGHIHHRITDLKGLNHKNTVIVLYCISATFGAIAFLLALSSQNAWDNTKNTLIAVGLSIFILLIVKSLGYLDRASRK